jgi:hypothetical protein
MGREAAGWPFLIGAGRRHEYRTLIAPDFLVETARYGIIDRHAGQAPDDETRVVRIRTGDHPLWMAYAARTVTEADVPDPRDEHGRPLRLLAGFVCDAEILEPDRGDLAVAHDTGLAVYRRYLADEDGFGVLASEPYPLRSILGTTTPPPPPPRPVRPRRRTAAILGAAAIVLAALLAALAVSLSGGAGPADDDTPACAPATAAAAAPTPACPTTTGR